MEILAIVPIILIAAFILGEMFKRIGLPSVVGQIVAGLLFGVPVIRELVFGEGSALVIIDFLATLGVLLLLFLAGLEIEIDKIKETSRDSILVSLSSALVPFALGFLFITVVFPEYGFLSALIFGGAMMVTSEGTKVKVLMDLNSINTRLGAGSSPRSSLRIFERRLPNRLDYWRFSFTNLPKRNQQTKQERND